jgi:hypothetical protein
MIRRAPHAIRQEQVDQHLLTSKRLHHNCICR